MNNKKGQAALEFLTTYGWAFLVIIVAVAGLSYFGVFSFENKIPNSCNTGAMLQCGSSYKIANVDTDTVSINLKNNEQATATITGLRIIEKSLASGTTSKCTGVVDTTTDEINPGVATDVYFDIATRTCGIDTNAGKKKTFMVEIDYLVTGSDITKTASGEISTQVQSS